jgi:hypothetical protein
MNRINGDRVKGRLNLAIFVSSKKHFIERKDQAERRQVCWSTKLKAPLKESVNSHEGLT